ncbi:HAD family hydrolase [Dysgonomonas macrotermitis]|uniref:Putative hydrolase of the HAD superfamily n=1 Tax=Dysgonomonas macrotermitis TaxID=1346286 RepID=A0A1M5EF40_9BACT|nr:HAD family phosphatase [Dysgonomonas macrotermitis]SHF77780.1 putative hydrolase of the HAD superfamily [Dysgonomonas macrotermitis]
MGNLTGIKNLLFDFGGVIVDINKEGAIKRFKEIGVDNIEEYLGEFRQKGIFLGIEEGTITRQEFYDELRKMTGKNISDKDIDSGWLGFLGGIPEYRFQLLRDLRKDYNLYLLSNTNPIIMEWAHSDTFTTTGETLSDFFDETFMSYKIGHTKPSKESFEAVIAAGINPEETLFLDDGQSNLDAAEKFGFKTYLVDQTQDLRKVFEK